MPNKELLEYLKKYSNYEEKLNHKKVVAPFKLKPAFKDYLWGGTKLKTDFDKSTDLDIVAESWELSAHPDGQSVIASGEFEGSLFGNFIKANPELCGSACKGAEDFPVLIKFIDAKQSLSIQVHPNDEYAREVEKEAGKTEIWIILDAEEDAFLYYGFKHEVSKEEFKERIENNTITDVLYEKKVKPGDVAFIPAGTIHAIGKGILLAEVQQNSNSTYRVYDFARKGVDGKERPLHIDKAMDVTSLKPAGNEAQGEKLLAVNENYSLEQLASCPYFTVQRLALNGSFLYPVDDNSFVSILCTDGNAVLESESGTLDIAKGDSVFVPAGTKGVLLKGECDILISKL